MDHVIKNLFIDDRLESYRNFFSDDWGQRIAELSKEAPKLEQVAFDLLADWRGAAYTVSFPTQMLEHFRTFAESYVSDPEPNTGTLRFAGAVLKKLSMALPELSADQQLQRALHQKVVTLASEIKDAHSQIQIEFPVEEVWKQHLGHHVYQITLWSALRICYVAIYNGYDNFVQRCTSLAASEENIRTTNHNVFKRKFCESFGESVYNQCWTSPAVDIARLARNALSHAGGRPSPRLLAQSHNFSIKDGVIHILPSDVKELYATLKDAAHALLIVAKDKPQFL